MPSAFNALAIIRRALPNRAPAEHHFVWAFTRLETGWGTGWKDNALGQLAHNWGAVTAPAGQGFTYNDPLEGRDRIHTFKIYPTDEAGAADAGRIALKPNVRAALASGDAFAAIGCMRLNGYFEAPADDYRAGVLRNYQEALRDSGEKSLLKFEPPSDVWLWLAGAAGLAWVFRKQLGLGK